MIGDYGFHRGSHSSNVTENHSLVFSNHKNNNNNHNFIHSQPSIEPIQTPGIQLFAPKKRNADIIHRKSNSNNSNNENNNNTNIRRPKKKFFQESQDNPMLYLHGKSNKITTTISKSKSPSLSRRSSPIHKKQYQENHNMSLNNKNRQTQKLDIMTSSIHSSNSFKKHGTRKKLQQHTIHDPIQYVPVNKTYAPSISQSPDSIINKQHSRLLNYNSNNLNFNNNNINKNHGISDDFKEQDSGSNGPRNVPLFYDYGNKNQNNNENKDVYG